MKTSRKFHVKTKKKNVFQFAYHEATFFLVRLLQQFTGFTLEKSENIQPPAEWAACDGLKATEKVYPTSHLTMYVNVSVIFIYQYMGLAKELSDGFFFFLVRAAFGSGWNRWRLYRGVSSNSLF